MGTAPPAELIDKGTLFYFWGSTTLLRGSLDRGYLLIHQSVEEDSRTSGVQIPLTPSYADVCLDYETPDQAFQFWPVEPASFLEVFVHDYVNTHPLFVWTAEVEPQRFATGACEGQTS